jgi:hypothetical protein
MYWIIYNQLIRYYVIIQLHKMFNNDGRLSSHLHTMTGNQYPGTISHGFTRRSPETYCHQFREEIMQS